MLIYCVKLDHALYSINYSISIVSTVCMLAWTLNLLVSLRIYRPHPLMQVNSSCSNSPLQWRRSRSVKSTIRLWQRIDLVSRFARGSVACWTGLSKRLTLGASCSRMHLYDHPFLCMQHCKSDQSWAFWTCSRTHLLPSRLGHGLYKEIIAPKIFFVVYSIISHKIFCVRNLQ